MRPGLLLLLLTACEPGDVTIDEDEAGRDGPVDLDGDGIPDADDPDADGDGFEAPEDCDDRDAAVNPAAEEICGNGKDDDCDGTANGCALPPEVDLTEIADRWVGELSGDGAGTSVAVTPDVGDDGYADVLVAARATGIAYRISGVPDRRGSLGSAAWSWRGTSPGFAPTLAGGDDVTGDGRPDVILPDPTFSTEVRGNVGRVLVLPASGQADPFSRTARVDGLSAFAGLGWAVRTDGDTDGDGTDTWIRDNVGWRRFDLQDGGVRTSAADEAFLPGGELGLGDLDGDGLDDVALAPTESTSTVVLYAGGFSGSRSLGSRDVVLITDDPRSRRVRAVDVGDVDGDGYGDTVVGAFSFREGAELLIARGDASLDAIDFDTVLAEDIGSLEQGTEVAALRARRDLDGDGDADIALGVGEDVWLVYDPEEGEDTLDAVATTVLRGTPGRGVVRALDAAAEANADFTRTLAVGAPDTGTGAIYLVRLPGL